MLIAMKKIFSAVALAVLMLLSATSVFAQGSYIIRMDASTHGNMFQMDTTSLTIRDDDSQGAGAPEAGSPQRGKDYYITIVSGCPAPSRMSIYVEELSLSCLDTLYIYNGPDTNGTLISKFNSFTGNVTTGDMLFESPTNNTGMITIRFRTDPMTDTNRTGLACQQYNGGVGKGFVLNILCGIPCEYVEPVIDSLFYRTRHGVIYDSGYTRLVTVLDTIYNTEGDTSSGINYVDTTRFIGAHLCIGDGVIFHGHGKYSYRYGYYTPTDATTFFRWDMANEGDTIVGYGLTAVEYNEYQRTGCYDVRLDIVDAYGCTSDYFASVKVRTALNPIKTIFTLSDICNRDSLMVNMGYDGDNATLTLRRIKQDSSVSKTYVSTTFIPDGCNCANPSYFEAPVEFTEFSNTARVSSYKDICSICINMEHSFMGDIFITIVCPTNKEAVLKWGNSVSCPPDGIPSHAPDTIHVTNGQGGQMVVPIHDGTGYGGGTFLGIPLDTQGGGNWDQSPKCDSVGNPYGFGLDYCFSRDTHYTLVTGQNAAEVWSWLDPCPTGNFYIVSNGNTVNWPVTYTPIPLGFNQTGLTPQGTSLNTRKPSNHEDKEDYYLPWATFKELVGCPLNGNWRIRVYDTWGADNGWIFNWSLDICNVSGDNDCKYQVGIDSLVWHPDTASQYHDYELGHYRGAKINAQSPTISHISTPDTAGTFPIIVKVYDEFGCVWDTNTRITSYWTPQPNLGLDTALCGVDTIVLDARDSHAGSENYSYMWSPGGETTPTITTPQEPTGSINYVVRVTNQTNTRVCVTRDTINIDLRHQPLPSFMPTPFVFEGCEPFTLSFDNYSVQTAQHFWDFGDGITSTLASPTHTYAAGIYDLKYYATSADGCIDSIISPQAIAVYSAPQAAFAWEPLYPSVLNPVIQFDNRTTPKTDYTKYFWEVQYNQDNPLSVETLTEEEPSFNFSQYTSDNPSGIYSVRLIARTDNLAPSGNVVYCRDTAENTILLVNDFLQFPNVVSPNGDGINDRFVIQNLVEGKGYPINSLDIYNKWGVRVFHKDNISSDEDFWDPKDMPTGTYFYRFSARGYNGNIEHNGAIEVVR